MSLCVAMILAAAQWAPSDVGYRLVNPKAIELFDRDQLLQDWAIRFFDSDGDGRLSVFEADKAAQEFKRVADGDVDGRVTPAEYRSARDFIRARW